MMGPADVLADIRRTSNPDTERVLSGMPRLGLITLREYRVTRPFPRSKSPRLKSHEPWRNRWLIAFVLASVFIWNLATPCNAAPLPETAELTWDGDIAARLVAQVDDFLLKQFADAVSETQLRGRDFRSHEAYVASLAPFRQRLANIVGLRDQRVTPVTLRIDSRLPIRGDAGTTTLDAALGEGANFRIYLARWPIFSDVEGIGLLLEPIDHAPVATVIAVPDCEVLPEQLVGLVPGVAADEQYARRLAEAGCRVIVPLLVNRQTGQFDWGVRQPAPAIPHREMLYRSAFEMGRSVLGYEIQSLQALTDWVRGQGPQKLGIIGWGEGGRLALFAGALDPRLDVVAVSGYFESRRNLWQEPMDRNLFGVLRDFDDAELASLIAPRPLLIEAARGPEIEIRGDGGAGPARLISPSLEAVQQEVHRAEQMVAELQLAAFPQLIITEQGQGAPGNPLTLQTFLDQLGVTSILPAQPLAAPTYAVAVADDTPQSRHHTWMQSLDRHTQVALRDSPRVRDEFMRRLDTSSIEAYERTAAEYREVFRREVIGDFERPLVAPRPRTRQVYETDKWRGYEVVLNVFDNVFAYGLLLLPKDLAPGEKRPVVVCQHGLEGRPQDTIGVQGSGAYAGFAGKLADQGFITFAPQNLYIGQDRFRTLQRKANPLQATLFSIIVPQHRQIVQWLKTLPYVDEDRIAFYGLSYGGKTAMRVPPLVTDYCLSICSADFNEWVDKNASTSNPRSYVWTSEYEIFEFNLGNTFNYAEMAALIAPRPFMVERGHFDGVADDWTVAWEYAKVRHLYAARLGLGDRTEIEWFVGPHTIHGQGTYEFLRHHLRFPATAARPE